MIANDNNEQCLLFMVFMVAEVDISEFRRLDLRIGRVIAAEKVKGTDRLIKMVVDFGGLKKQAVAGLGHIYEPEHFVGRLYAFVLNLKPRKIRGEISECMILAATASEEDIAPLIPEKSIREGSPIT
ncbi:MAG: methionine--tRNA ligase [Nitrososphaerota archaeon]|nr:methionine--tRNA ligase [Nitrososphaerota archaeon]